MAVEQANKLSTRSPESNSTMRKSAKLGRSRSVVQDIPEERDAIMETGEGDKPNEPEQHLEETVEEKPKNKFSDALKVIRKASEDDPKSKEKVLATLKMAQLSYATLADVKGKIGKLEEPSEFCFSDLSPADDSMDLQDYLNQEHDGIDFKGKLSSKVARGQLEPETTIVKCVLYVVPKPIEPAKKPEITADNLKHAKFAIKVFEWSAGEEGIGSRGTLQSSKLGVPDASLMTLAGLRKQLATCTKMSVAPKQHVFCTQSGETVVDEAMTFSDYLKLEEVQADTEAELRLVHVFYKLAHPRNEPRKIELSELPGKVTSDDIKFTGQEFAGGKQADAFERKERWTEIPKLDFQNGASSNQYAVDASYLTDVQWAEVLRNCGIMYGWIIDRQKNKIIRAPKPAFQLRAKISNDPVYAIPDLVEVPPEEKDQTERGSSTEQEEGPTATSKSQDHPVAISASSEAPADTPDNDISSDSQTHTESPDTQQGHIEDLQRVDVAIPSQQQEQTPLRDQIEDLQRVDVAEPRHQQQQQVSQDQATAKQTTTTATVATAPRVPARPAMGTAVYTVLPSFQVNDDSKIEITVSSHEFETSMAKNDFSNQSTEGSLSAGWGGFSANVSAGYGSESSKGEKYTNNTYKKTMIAKYLLPRADILLHSTDIEPTPELKAALEKIRISKNVNDLRRLYEDFGQLWCQRVTVGSRLQSTQIMTEITATSEQEQKEAFKASVGLQVTTPFGVGAGVKHSREKGSQTTNNQANVDRDESSVFEAVGGDTILAANPEAWAPTVADYRSWRVIDRGSLSTLADAISALPGYAPVRNWFMQAVPTLSKYIELLPSREINLRFKLTAPTSQLSLSYLKKSEQYDASGDPLYYFGHSANAEAKPVKNDLTLSNGVWTQCDITDARPLFSPQSYRGPVLYGYSSNLVGDAAYGTKFTQDYANTLWKISAPFNDALSHGALVCIQTVPLPKTEVKVDGPAKDTTDAPLSLVAFRNQQSVFLPGLSDTSERHFWRILKYGARTPGEYIKEGDEVYFAWAFKDQTSGFRDFSQDVFGRRRLQFPEDLSGQVLYMKLPWPRFEPLAKPATGKQAAPNSMILTAEPPSMNGMPQHMPIKTVPGMTAAVEAIAKGLRISDEAVYGVQDVRFRVDVVGNDGRGDVGDQLLQDLDQGIQMQKMDPRVAAMLSMVEAQLKLYEAFLFLGR